MTPRPHALAAAALIAAFSGCDYGRGPSEPGSGALDSLVVRPSSIALHASGVRYGADVQPIFNASCALTRCHAGNARAAGLSLASFERLAEGGFSGAVVRAGDPEGSPLIQRIESDEPSVVMPQFGPSLPAERRALLRGWVRDGLVGFRAVLLAGDDSTAVAPAWSAGPGGRIDAGGLFTVDVASGTITVTASADGRAGRATVTVSP